MIEEFAVSNDSDTASAITVGKLSSNWSIWLEKSEKPSGNKFWLTSLQQIYQFGCISDFWCWFDNSVIPSHIPSSIRSIRVFKTGTSLAREDKQNQSGGRVLIDFRLFNGNPDFCWLKVLLFILSDEYKEFSSLINGVVAGNRLQYTNKPLKIQSGFDSLSIGGHKSSPQLQALTKASVSNTANKVEKKKDEKGQSYFVKIEIWLSSRVLDEDNLFIERLSDCLYSYLSDDLLSGGNFHSINNLNGGSSLKKEDFLTYQKHF
jgi:hypothetical protein